MEFAQRLHRARPFVLSAALVFNSKRFTFCKLPDLSRDGGDRAAFLFPFHLPLSYSVTGSNSISLLHQWDKNRQVHNDLDERFQELENGSLSITEVRIQDAGTYGCTAGNKGGLSRYT